MAPVAPSTPDITRFTTATGVDMPTTTSICLRAALFVDNRTEFETLYLSGSCFRKLGKEFYAMRAFEDRQSAKHKFLQFTGKFRRARSTVTRHDAGDRFGQFVFVLAEDHRRFLYGGMLDQHALNLNGADPHAAHFQHVVGSSRVPKISVFILIVLVARPDPMALNRVFGLLMLVPIVSTGRVGLNQKIADFTLHNRPVVVVHDSGLEPGNNLSTGARSRSRRDIGDDHVKCFCRADGIQDFHSESLFEAMKNSGRQGLPGGYCMPHTRKVEFPSIPYSVSEKLDVVRWDRKEQRWPVARDDVEHTLRFGWTR